MLPTLPMFRKTLWPSGNGLRDLGAKAPSSSDSKPPDLNHQSNFGVSLPGHLEMEPPSREEAGLGPVGRVVVASSFVQVHQLGQEA